MDGCTRASATRCFGFALFFVTLIIVQGGCATRDLPEVIRQTLVARAVNGRTWSGSDLAHRSKALLVVMTYGFGCSGSGPGNGLRDLANMIRARHPEQRVITRGWNDNDDIALTIADHDGPVALIGHSFGGSQSVDLAAAVGRPIEWMVLLDPVPCNDWAIRHEGKYFEVPANVRNAVCYHRPFGGWPTSYSIVNPANAQVNRMRRVGHSDFGASSEVREQILALCDAEAAARTMAKASGAAKNQGQGGQQAAGQAHGDQVGNAVGNYKQSEARAQGNHAAGLLAVHEHAHADGSKNE
jgi:pimeloyl-ACP methyl ester carboxylesterase